ncbi:MAG TPA: DUF4440 domain-containing protein, partial [Methylomirabilota bacterium]|nr:DUF4440 domain-containing protein [Methylomirabilota bacterium]
MTQPRTGEHAALRRLDVEFVRLVNAGDASGAAGAFYAEDAVLMPPNRPVVEGRAKIRTYLQSLIDGGLQHLTLEPVDTEVSGELAYTRARYALALAPPDAPTVHDVGKSLVVYRRQAEGGWRAVADIFNSDH